MGGSGSDTAHVLSYGLVDKKKGNKKPKLSPQQRKNIAAKSATPLLQETAITPDEKATGAGTALL